MIIRNIRENRRLVPKRNDANQARGQLLQRALIEPQAHHIGQFLHEPIRQPRPEVKILRKGQQPQRAQPENDLRDGAEAAPAGVEVDQAGAAGELGGKVVQRVSVAVQHLQRVAQLADGGRQRAGERGLVDDQPLHPHKLGGQHAEPRGFRAVLREVAHLRADAVHPGGAERLEGDYAGGDVFGDFRRGHRVLDDGEHLGERDVGPDAVLAVRG